MNPLVLIVIGALVLLLVILALSAIRIVQQYERGVIFVLGRLTGAKGPGLHHVQARSVHISTASDPQDLTLDGEVRGQTPAIMRMAEQRLRVIVPG